jgi:hypothetical protein
MVEKLASSPPPNKPRPSGQPKAPPMEKTFAEAARFNPSTPSRPDDGFQTVGPKKADKKADKKPAAKTPTTIYQKPYPRSHREIIIQLPRAPFDPARSADAALKVANTAITDHKDITHPPFILSRITPSNALVLTTAITWEARAYEPYLGILMDALSDVKPVSARVNERWSKFLLHNVPTDAPLEQIRADFETNYPALKLGMTPRWLSTPEKRAGKTASTIVVAVIGSITLDQIGVRTVAICNRLCRLEEYFGFSASTQCPNCQQYGHHPKKCTAPAACAVCALPHLTRDHPCTITTCKAGPACQHPPIKCVSCGSPHKATDPNCPTRIKLIELRRPAQPPAPAITVA